MRVAIGCRDIVTSICVVYIALVIATFVGFIINQKCSVLVSSTMIESSGVTVVQQKFQSPLGTQYVMVCKPGSSFLVDLLTVDKTINVNYILDIGGKHSAIRINEVGWPIALFIVTMKWTGADVDGALVSGAGEWDVHSVGTIPVGHVYAGFASIGCYVCGLLVRKLLVRGADKCVGCGYVIAGIRGTRCPECGRTTAS